MTICAVWRENSEIKFAADTRISFRGKSLPFDGATKISPIRMEVDVVNPHTLSDEEHFYGDIGVCFAGSVVNSFVLKDAFLHALRGWVILDWRQTPPFSMYVESVFHAYEDISRQICNSLLGPDGLAEISIAGYCLNKNRYEAYLFEPNISTGTFTCKEVATNEGEFVFFGSGKDLAMEAYQRCNRPFDTATAKKVITELIESERVPNVGGKVQIGGFNGRRSFATAVPR